MAPVIVWSCYCLPAMRSLQRGIGETKICGGQGGAVRSVMGAGLKLPNADFTLQRARVERSGTFLAQYYQCR